MIALLVPAARKLFFVLLAALVVVLVLFHPATALAIVVTVIGTVWDLLVQLANLVAATVTPGAH